MKLAYVYDAVYPWEMGGVQKRVWELSRRLADEHDVHWYGLHYWDGPAVIEREGVTLHGVAAPQELYVNDRRSIAEALYFSTHLVPALHRSQFEIIDCQVFPYFSCYASKLSTAFDASQLVLTWHEVWGDFWYEYLGALGFAGRLVEQGTTALSDEHIAVSERTRRDLSVHGGSTLLPNGIDIDMIAETDAADEDIDVLFVGRFIWEKNPMLLVEAIAKLREEHRDIQCYLVGDGPERGVVDRVIAERRVEEHVSVLGFRESYTEIIALMKAADVFVLPSRREGFGITVLEALACGTPVVTIEHPDNAATELVSNGETGFIVEPTDDAVAEGIRKALLSIEPGACVAAAAEYDWDVIAAEAESLYLDINS